MKIITINEPPIRTGPKRWTFIENPAGDIELQSPSGRVEFTIQKADRNKVAEAIKLKIG